MKLFFVATFVLVALSSGVDAKRRKKSGSASSGGGGGGADGPDPRMLLPFDEIDGDNSKTLSEDEVRAHLLKNLDMLK
eukprot:gene15990-1725_t